MAKERLHAFVSGLVQGVNFRYHTIIEAQRLGLTGWVRNLRDGRVEAVAEGERADVERFLDFLRHGPRAARVSDVQASWEPASDEFRRFDVRF